MGTYIYIRVSSSDQNEIRQLEAMEVLGIPSSQIYIDKQSGKDFKRPAWQKIMKQLRKGDVLYIKSVDRMGRNHDEIIEQWRLITKEKQADIVILDMPLLDTRSKAADLTSRFIFEMVLLTNSYMAESEQINIRMRQAEGIASAKARGVRFGPVPQKQPENYVEVVGLREQKKISLQEALELTGLSKSAYYRFLKEHKAHKKSSK